jgi:hypothetical protein
LANSVNKSILYVAYHYPPVLGSSGVHRTLAFTRYLQEHNWQVQVISVSLKAYDAWTQEQFSFIPPGVEVTRAYARNVTKHYAIKGRYTKWMALPDKWQSWIIGGFLSGLKAIRSNRPSVIVSTYPIASAHVIAYLLHKVSGIPWIADFRDPMVQTDYPKDKYQKKVWQWIEKKAVKHCKRIIFTAPGALKLYKERFPNIDANTWQLIPNGFDEAMFKDLDMSSEPLPKTAGLIRLLHAGIVYPSERDPAALFKAIAELKQEDKLNAKTFQLWLRGTAHDDHYRATIEALGIDDIILLKPPVTYKKALKEMLEVEGLLLLQAKNCHYQIPAKAYEYIRARKPVLALTEDDSDTGKVISGAGVAMLAPLDDSARIKEVLLSFIDKVQEDSFKFLSEEEIMKYSRAYQGVKFMGLMEEVLS